MRNEVAKELERVSKIIGINITEELIKEQTSAALASLMRQGLPKKYVEQLLKSARPLGDFGWFQRNMPNDSFQEFFGGPVRKWGIDGSIDNKYGCFGSSSQAEILNISPWGCSIDIYERFRGRPSKSDPDKEDIFDAGHWIEPVYRHYFDRMYGERYQVIECDIQFASRKYAHFIGNVDGLLYDKETGQFGILEIKHTSSNNVKTIQAVKDGDVPEYWDVQERGYMELLDADFACLFLGWGNRPGLETNAMHRTERDKNFGESLLEQCEDFMVGNVEAGVKPSYRNVKDPARVKESIEELYGPVSHKKKTIEFDESFEDNFNALEEAQKAIDEAKKKESLAKEEVAKAEKAYELLQTPIIEAMKNVPKGEYAKQDGTRYYVSYDVKNGLDVERVRSEFPVAYDACNKAAVDTSVLKKKYPDVYTTCFGPKIGSKRSFSLKVWRPKA